MAEQKGDTLKIVGIHEPDSSVETDENGHKHEVALPGNYRVGFHVGDKFVTLALLKAGNILDADGKPLSDATDS